MALSKIPSAGFQDNVNFKNVIINGDMSLAQRGTSTTGVTTTDGYYACDRWYTQTDIGTWTISQSTDVPSGQGFSNSLKLDCTSAGTSNADEVGIRHKIEGQNLQYLRYGTSSAKSLTVSFWIKSNKTGTYSLSIVNDETSQARIVSFNYTISSANTWEKKTITFPGDTSTAIDNTNGEEFVLYWWFSAASSFTSGGVQNTWTNYSASYHADSSLAGLGGSTSDEVYITGVQAEAGTTASDFEFLPVDVNTQRCLRYFEKLTGESIYSSITSNGNSYVQWYFKSRKRAAPTVTNSGTGATGTINRIHVDGAGLYKSNAHSIWGTTATADAEL